MFERLNGSLIQRDVHDGADLAGRTATIRENEGEFPKRFTYKGETISLELRSLGRVIYLHTITYGSCGRTLRGLASARSNGYGTLSPTGRNSPSGYATALCLTNRGYCGIWNRTHLRRLGRYWVHLTSLHSLAGHADRGPCSFLTFLQLLCGAAGNTFTQ